LEIYDRFDQMGVEFAYPTQTIYLERQEALESPKE
jgi:small-conductance mechanosensitive channel